MGGIHAGDAALLSLQATSLDLRAPEHADGRPSGCPAARTARAPHFSASARHGGARPRAGGATRRRSHPPRDRGGIGERTGSADCVVAGEAAAAGSRRMPLIVAAPAHEAARLLRSLDPALQRAAGRDPVSPPPSVIHLGYRERMSPHPLDGYGYLIPGVERSDPVACTWSSQKWEGRAPAGPGAPAAARRRSAGGTCGAVSDEELFGLARGELAATARASPRRRCSRVCTGGTWACRSTPSGIHGVSPPSRSAPRAGPGLFLAGSSYRGVGIPDCIESGAPAAPAAAHLANRGRHMEPDHDALD